MENQRHRLKSCGRLTDKSPNLDKPLNSTACSHQLVTKDSRTVAESHSKRRSSLFRRARDMGLEISGTVALAVDVILLTFIFVWKERRKGDRVGIGFYNEEVPLSPLPVDN